jgi:hypothetical protein
VNARLTMNRASTLADRHALRSPSLPVVTLLTVTLPTVGNVTSRGLADERPTRPRSEATDSR